MAEREHSWDTIRALLMLLGIPFHAALPYSYFANTVVLSDDPSLAAEFLGSFLHSFRMGAFFVVAGYFAAHAITRKGRGDWWSARWRTLGIPLLVAALCFIPIQLYIRALDLTGGGANLGSVYLQLLLTPGPHWTGHLWFLIVLLEFCLLTALFWPRIAAPLVRLGEYLAGRPPLLIAAFVVPLVLLPRTLLALLGLDQGAVAMLVDTKRFAEYAPFFVLGLLLLLVPALLASFSRLRWQTTLGALGASAAFVAFDYLGMPAPAIAAKAMAGTLVCALLLGLARRYCAQPNRPVRWLVGAAFTIYLFHFPIVCLLAYLLEGSHVPPDTWLAVLVFATLAATCLIHSMIARSPTMLLLFNGRPFPKSRSAQPVTESVVQTS